MEDTKLPRYFTDPKNHAYFGHPQTPVDLGAAEFDFTGLDSSIDPTVHGTARQSLGCELYRSPYGEEYLWRYGANKHIRTTSKAMVDFLKDRAGFDIGNRRCYFDYYRIFRQDDDHCVWHLDSVGAAGDPATVVLLWSDSNPTEYVESLPEGFNVFDHRAPGIPEMESRAEQMKPGRLYLMSGYQIHRQSLSSQQEVRRVLKLTVSNETLGG